MADTKRASRIRSAAVACVCAGALLAWPAQPSLSSPLSDLSAQSEDLPPAESGVSPGQAPDSAPDSAPAESPEAAAARGPRRVNIPYFDSGVDWTYSAIFWFGKNEQGVPSRNYADVRMGYTRDALRILVTVVDYYLWFSEDPTPATDLTQYDAVAIYLDTAHDRSTAPKTDDYWVLLGSHWPGGNSPEYHRQARGTGTGWNTAWSGAWTDYVGMEWYCNPGPNGNDCGIDFGWMAYIDIPFSALGLPSPPPAGKIMGLGMVLYDRDAAPPAGGVPPQTWPETFQADNPSTWGEVHLGPASYTPPNVTPQGTTRVRASSPTDNTVEDAWMGGGGLCAGGHEGGSEINHGADTNLFVGSEYRPTHFPCFNKTYLRFSLNAIPPGKAIISASLTLHLWGNAEPSLAQPSWVHLFTVRDPWDEMTIHWNNAPLAQENVSAAWMDKYRRNPIVWPGDPYTWDASQAVAEAYALGEPLNLALYSSDTDEHSSKYLTASEVGDWDVEGRPTLVVVWGEAVPSAELDKQVKPAALTRSSLVTYTLAWLGRNQALTLTDNVPTEVSAPQSLSATAGAVSYNAAERRVTWSGSPASGQRVTVTYAVSVPVQGSTPRTISSTGTLRDASGVLSVRSASLVIHPRQAFTPIIRQ